GRRSATRCWPAGDGGTSCAPWRSRAGRRGPRSEEECEAEFPFVCVLVLVALREDVVGLVLGAQEEAPREVVAYSAADVGGLLGAVCRLHQGGLRLDVHQPQADGEEWRPARLGREHVREADVAGDTVGELAEVVADRALEPQLRIEGHRAEGGDERGAP